MRISTISNAPTPVLAPGSVAARLKDLTTGETSLVLADGIVAGTTTYATRQAAFAAGYAASLGDAAGAILVLAGRAGFVLQYALSPTADGAPKLPFAFEHLQSGSRPVPTRGELVPGLAAIIDGAELIVPAN